MPQTVHYMVTGEQKIHCVGCEERITKAMQRLPGVQDVQSSHETQQVVVIDPAQVTLGHVRVKLELLGYRVQPGSDRDSAKPLLASGGAGMGGALPERRVS